MEEKIDRILALLEENNEILKEIKSKIEMSESEECVTKRTLHDFINNVVADLFADMLLQPKGRGHVSREDIMQFIKTVLSVTNGSIFLISSIGLTKTM